MPDPFTILLGTAQDGGYPHVGCRRECCADAWNEPELRRNVACLGIVDTSSRQRWLIDCTPDLPRQLRMLTDATQNRGTPKVDGIFLTHAHIGHYTGLMYLGHEASNANNLPVFAMPRMRDFLESNEPWGGLIRNGHIALQSLNDGERVELNQRIAVTPFLVPHRGEHSETVGYRIAGPNRTVAYVPDIDDWRAEALDVLTLIESVDFGYLDGTFFDGSELPHRNTAEVPHPCIRNSVEHFGTLSESNRAKVRFTHFNHTNPVLRPDSDAAAMVRNAGMGIANDGDVQMV